MRQLNKLCGLYLVLKIKIAYFKHTPVYPYMTS